MGEWASLRIAPSANAIRTLEYEVPRRFDTLFRSGRCILALLIGLPVVKNGTRDVSIEDQRSV